jgi:hypothetical protein
MSPRLRIDGLSNIALDLDVRTMCAVFGKVVDVCIVPNPETGLGSGTAVVEMETTGERDQARGGLNGQLHYGQELSVEIDQSPDLAPSSNVPWNGSTEGRSGKGSPTGFGRSRG